MNTPQHHTAEVGLSLAGCLEDRDALRAAGDALAGWVAALDLEEDEDGYGPERFLLLRAWDDARTGAVTLGPARRQT